MQQVLQAVEGSGVTICCRGPARRRMLCVTSPPRGLCPIPALKCSSCKSSGERCRARPERNSQSKPRCPRRRFCSTAAWSVASGRLIIPRSSHIYDRRIRKSGKRPGEATGPLCAGHSVQTIKGQPCPFCRRQVYDKKKQPTAVCRSFSSLLVLATDTPPSMTRGPGPAQPSPAGTRSLKDFFHLQTRSATLASQSACAGAASSPFLLSEVTIPVWGEGQARSWYRYKVRAGVFHIGAEATSGHYRAFWYSSPHETLMTGDDAVRPSPASASDAKRVREGSFLLFLVRQ